MARRRALALHALEHRDHFFRLRLPDDLKQQRLRVNVGAPTSLAHLFGHRREGERLRDRRSALAEPLGHLLVRVAVALGERLQAVGLLERAEVLSLQVLDERDLHRLRIGGIAHDAGDLGQARLDRGPVTPLAGDDLEVAAHGAHEDRLQDPLLAHGGDQLAEVSHHVPRLLRVRRDVFDGDELSHGEPARPAELVDEVRVVPHAHGLGQAEASGSGARHVR